MTSPRSWKTNWTKSAQVTRNIKSSSATFGAISPPPSPKPRIYGSRKFSKKSMRCLNRTSSHQMRMAPTHGFVRTAARGVFPCAPPAQVGRSLVAPTIQSVATRAPSVPRTQKPKPPPFHRRAKCWARMRAIRFGCTRDDLGHTCSAAKSPRTTKSRHASRSRRNGHPKRWSWRQPSNCLPYPANSAHIPKTGSWSGRTSGAMAPTSNMRNPRPTVAAPMPILNRWMRYGPSV